MCHFRFKVVVVVVVFHLLVAVSLMRLLHEDILDDVETFPGFEIIGGRLSTVFSSANNLEVIEVEIGPETELLPRLLPP